MTGTKKGVRTTKRQYNFIPYFPQGQSPNIAPGSPPTPSEFTTSLLHEENFDLDTWNTKSEWIFLQIMLGIHLKLKHSKQATKAEIWKHALYLFQEELTEQEAEPESFIKALTTDKIQKKWDSLRDQYLELRISKAEGNSPGADFVYYEEIEHICKYDPEVILENNSKTGQSMNIPDVDLARDEKLADERAEKNNVKRISSLVIHARILEPSADHANSQSETIEVQHEYNQTDTPNESGQSPQLSNDHDTQANGLETNQNTPQNNTKKQSKASSSTQVNFRVHQKKKQRNGSHLTPPPNSQNSPDTSCTTEKEQSSFYNKFDNETEMLTSCLHGFFQHAEGVSIQMMRSYREEMKHALKSMEQMIEEDRKKRKADMIELLEIFEQRQDIKQEAMFQRLERLCEQQTRPKEK